MRANLFYISLLFPARWGLAFRLSPQRSTKPLRLALRASFNKAIAKDNPQTDVTTEGNLVTSKDAVNYIDITSQSYADGVKPDSIWNLATSNFARQGGSIVDQLLRALGFTDKEYDSRPPKTLKLKLSNDAVAAVEQKRVEAGGGIADVNPVSKLLYDVGCLVSFLPTHLSLSQISYYFSSSRHQRCSTICLTKGLLSAFGF
jgi:hypothetical protein